MRDMTFSYLQLCSRSRSILCILFQESDCESSCGSPEPASTMGMDGSTDIQLTQKLFQNRTDDLPPSEAKVSSASAVTNPHLNGTSWCYF